MLGRNPPTNRLRFANTWIHVAGSSYDLLVTLTDDLAKTASSPIGRRARDRFGGYSRSAAERLTSGPVPLELRIDSLFCKSRAPSAIECEYDWAIKSVFAFAILGRYAEYVEQERQKSGFRRRFVNKAGQDLLLALQQAWEAGDNDLLAAIIHNEGQFFLRVVACSEAFAARVRLYLGHFQAIAEEAQQSGGIINLDLALAE